MIRVEEASVILPNPYILNFYRKGVTCCVMNALIRSNFCVLGKIRLKLNKFRLRITEVLVIRRSTDLSTFSIQ